MHFITFAHESPQGGGGARVGVRPPPPKKKLYISICEASSPSYCVFFLHVEGLFLLWGTLFFFFGAHGCWTSW